MSIHDDPKPPLRGELAAFRRKLRRWFKQHGRSLPWRDTRDPYRIWISEIMLQQTQVATVVDYYRRFMQRFPSVVDLAAAEEQDVLAMWAGLGYYRRARQLHAAAKQIVSDHQGHFPQALAAVLALPGIGRYTAGAITSFAFDARSPIVEANTIRLYSRLMAMDCLPTTAAAQRQLWAFAEEILPPRGKGSSEINQALMELGSLVCKPAAPRCEACPVAEHCIAHERGIQERLPISKPKAAAEERVHISALIERDGQYLLRQNETGEWWQGLWDFPRCDVTSQLRLAAAMLERPPPPAAIAGLLSSQFDLDCEVDSFYRTLRHGVTRYKIVLHCYMAKYSSGGSGDIIQIGPTPLRVAEHGHVGFNKARLAASKTAADNNGTWQWATLDDLTLPLTSTAQKLRKLLLADRGRPT